jgi:Arc/MetJ-type ribon-helix-helix transcriptional regulator
MHLSLNPDIQKQIDDRVKSGQYATAEEVVAAAIMTLDGQERFGDFQTGELDKLLAEGEHSIEQDGTLDGEEAFQQRRRRRAENQNRA